jgi:hypothetical protein
MSDKKKARKASEVVLSLEDRVSKMENKLDIIDVNVKAILNKLNLAGKEPKVRAPEPTKPTQPIAVAKPVSGPIVQAPIPTQEDVVFPQVEAPPEENRKSVVEQRITYDDGRPVILASVTISDAEIKTNTIAKIKTDGHGKWHTQLFGGKYIVEVVKGPTAAKRGFKIEYEIEAPGDGKPLTLERKQVG